MIEGFPLDQLNRYTDFLSLFPGNIELVVCFRSFILSLGRWGALLKLKLLHLASLDLSARRPCASSGARLALSAPGNFGRNLKLCVATARMRAP